MTLPSISDYKRYPMTKQNKRRDCEFNGWGKYYSFARHLYLRKSSRICARCTHTKRKVRDATE